MFTIYYSYVEEGAWASSNGTIDDADWGGWTLDTVREHIQALHPRAAIKGFTISLPVKGA